MNVRDKVTSGSKMKNLTRNLTKTIIEILKYICKLYTEKVFSYTGGCRTRTGWKVSKGKSSSIICNYNLLRKANTFLASFFLGKVYTHLRIRISYKRLKYNLFTTESKGKTRRLLLAIEGPNFKHFIIT